MPRRQYGRPHAAPCGKASYVFPTLFDNPMAVLVHAYAIKFATRLVYVSLYKLFSNFFWASCFYAKLSST